MDSCLRRNDGNWIAVYLGDRASGKAQYAIRNTQYATETRLSPVFSVYSVPLCVSVVRFAVFRFVLHRQPCHYGMPQTPRDTRPRGYDELECTVSCKLWGGFASVLFIIQVGLLFQRLMLKRQRGSCVSLCLFVAGYLPGHSFTRRSRSVFGRESIVDQPCRQ